MSEDPIYEQMARILRMELEYMRSAHLRNEHAVIRLVFSIGVDGEGNEELTGLDIGPTSRSMSPPDLARHRSGRP